MTYEMAMLMNWLLVVVGFLASDLFADLFDGGSDEADEEAVEQTDEGVPRPTEGTVILSEQPDSYVGTASNDTVFGQGGDDSLDGAAGDDVIAGQAGDDTLLGGDGQDRLAGGAGNDRMFGGDGNDVLASDGADANTDFAVATVDILDGGAGDDRLIFSGNDVATGGEGADCFEVIPSDGALARITDFEVGEDALVIYVDGLADAAEPPVVTYDTNEDAGLTTVFLEGDPVVRLDGLLSEDDLAITLADADEIDFSTKPEAPG